MQDHHAETVAQGIAKPTVLVVDDSADNLALMSGLLKEHYKVKVANNGETALKIAAAATKPDLILLDVVMPGMNGYQVCQALKSDAATSGIPLIFLTAKSSIEDEEMGLGLGGADYITKPVSPPIVLARVNTQLQNKRAADFLKDQNQFLEKEVEKRSQQLTAIQDVTIQAMASLAETRDSDTGLHITRTKKYVRALAMQLRGHSRFAAELTADNIVTLYKSAPLHDIGKVGIPDKILLKPGPLTAEEFEIMKTHSQLGFDALDHAEKVLGVKVEFLVMAKQIAYSHHEKWDGSGYPQGLRGDEIPIAARLMALADVYDALISKRIYKEGKSHQNAIDIIVQGAATHFDPDVVDAFLVIQDKFDAIATKYSDDVGVDESWNKCVAA